MLQIEVDNSLYMTYFLQLLCHLDQMVIENYLKIYFHHNKIYSTSITTTPGKTNKKGKKEKFFFSFSFSFNMTSRYNHQSRSHAATDVILSSEKQHYFLFFLFSIILLQVRIDF